MDKTKLNRNQEGLFDHVEYVFGEDGYIDWKKMIPVKFLVPNKDRFRDRTKEEFEALEAKDLEDRDLLILLGGIKYIAKLRGFVNNIISVKYASDTKVICECRIDWIPNYETEMGSCSSCGVGEASLSNTKGFGQLFLAAIAENRAFVRCVRNFLGVNIVANDEVVEGYAIEHTQTPQMGKMAPSMSPTGLLEKALKEKNSNFAALRKALINAGGTDAEEAEKWETLKDISDRMAMDLISRIKNSDKKPRGRPKKV